jgi:hypothetical protein
MRNKPNFSKSQMFITLVITRNYNEKWTMDTWSKRTQSNPIYGEPVEPTKPTCPERSRRVEPNLRGQLALRHIFCEVGNDYISTGAFD